jgi:hypothetical protein
MYLTPQETREIHERRIREIMEYNEHLRDDRVEKPKRFSVKRILLTLVTRT